MGSGVSLCVTESLLYQLLLSVCDLGQINFSVSRVLHIQNGDEKNSFFYRFSYLK